MVMAGSTGTTVGPAAPSRVYSDEQKVKRAARSRAWYEANRDRVLARLRDRTPEEREAAYARRRERYAADPTHRVKAREQTARWRAKPENQQAIEDAKRRYYHSERGQQTRRVKVLSKFHLTPEQYDAMAAEQRGVCAICHQPESRLSPVTGLVAALSVDHDHRCCPDRGRSCGECVRGLLCDRCNLGRFGDDPALLRAAADYFEARSRS